MPSIPLEQALFSRPDHGTARLIARSTGFQDAWIGEAAAIAFGFGDRPSEAFRCPPAVIFARPVGDRHVAVVRVTDDADVPATKLPGAMRFHFLIVDRPNYEAWIRDPFLLAAKVEPHWEGAELPTVTLATEGFSPRKVSEVQEVLKRIKRSALRPGDDPNSPDFERTIENSESPVLLGGAQILVDGGRLVFERRQGDLDLVSGLWLLLPEGTRSRLWPTSFAFAQDLEFDVLVLPHMSDDGLPGYTSEEQAGDYPQGAYELALQRAAEAGDQKELDAVFARRDGWQTLKLGLVLLLLLSLVVLASRWLDSSAALPVQAQKVAAAVGIIGAGDPWTALGMIVHGNHLWRVEDAAP